MTLYFHVAKDNGKNIQHCETTAKENRRKNAGDNPERIYEYIE